MVTQDAASSLLEMRRVSKSFPGVRALNDVSFDVRPGEVHVLLGENGAGKSTLIKILSGVYPMDEGEILLGGRTVSISSPHHAQQLGVSTIYQEFNLVPALSVAENIFLGKEPLVGPLGVVNWSKMYADARALLDSLDIHLNPKTPVFRLGVALQQMTEIAKALSYDARIIVMDEPTATLTDHEISQLFKTVAKLKASGVGIIYISHRLEEVFLIGDRATVLRDGEYVGTVNVAETTMNELIRMMVGRELKDKFVKEDIPRGEEILRVEGLTRHGVLSDVSFSLHRGEILGFAGLVGAGRTEIARAIFGADPIDGGRIAYKGQPFSVKNPNDAIKHGIGLLPEDRKRQGVTLSMSIKDNTTMAILDRLSLPLIGWLNLGRERRLAEEYREKLRIRTPNVQRLVKNLSGGNQQKVVLAKWLASQADVLIFDEPTRGIDVGAKVEVYQLMNELARQGAGIIMISSELPEILGMSDRILVVRGGRIAGELSREEATQEKILALAMAEGLDPELHQLPAQAS